MQSQEFIQMKVEGRRVRKAEEIWKQEQKSVCDAGFEGGKGPWDNAGSLWNMENTKKWFLP